jgi:hypothetical protein
LAIISKYQTMAHHHNQLTHTLLPSEIPEGGVNLILKDVGFKIKKSKGGYHEILRNITGQFQCGKV